MKIRVTKTTKTIIQRKKTITYKMNTNEILIEAIIKGIQEKKGSAISVIDLSNTEGAICSSIVVCQGNSPTQVEAISDSIWDVARIDAGEKPLRTVGLENCQWVAMDYGDVMVHVFLPDTRSFYDLDHMWADAPTRHVEDPD